MQLKKLSKTFNEIYNFLYENDKFLEYSSLVDGFDFNLKNNDDFKQLVDDFCNYQGDFISSDRESAAFMGAVNCLGLMERA